LNIFAFFFQTEIRSDKENGHKLDNAVDGSCGTKTKCGRKVSAMEVDDKWLTSYTAGCQMKDICRANELCGSLSECVSKPDCCTLWFRERSLVKNIVDPTQAFKPLSLGVQEWLSPASQNYTNKTTSDSMNDMFQHIQDVKSSIWLMNHSMDSPVNKSPPSKFKGAKEESNLWLQKSSANVMYNSSGGPVKSSPTNSDVADWLMVSNEDHEKHQEMHDHDKESEGWSICSDCHSTCTDQCAKDIATANDYFSKWLY
jgi:hypothetical protein